MIFFFGWLDANCLTHAQHTTLGWVGLSMSLLTGMCGTAAVVVKVNSITYGDKTMNFDDFETGMNGVTDVDVVNSWMVFAVYDVWNPQLMLCLSQDVISGLRSELTAIQCSSPSSSTKSAREEFVPCK